MTEQEIKDILQQQNHFFSSGKTIPAEFRLKQLEGGSRKEPYGKLYV